MKELYNRVEQFQNDQIINNFLSIFLAFDNLRSQLDVYNFFKKLIIKFLRIKKIYKNSLMILLI